MVTMTKRPSFFLSSPVLIMAFEIRTFLHHARNFLLNDLQGALLAAPWLTKDQCIEECGLFSHLPGIDDFNNFTVLNAALFRRDNDIGPVNSPLINNKLLPVHFAISFKYESGEFVWDETGDIVENGYNFKTEKLCLL